MNLQQHRLEDVLSRRRGPFFHWHTKKILWNKNDAPLNLHHIKDTLIDGNKVRAVIGYPKIFLVLRTEKIQYIFDVQVTVHRDKFL